MNAIDRIHELLRFGSVLGLDRMNALLERLGNPHEDLKVIHVAGTNGKGSICRYIYESLREGGYRTGLYSSPFIEIFNERIELDGEYISDEDLEIYTDRVLEKVKEMTDEGLESPTEFEVVTAIAFLYFKEKNTDYVVLEVGLGGRGDSTNVVKNPLACVIASISLDHTDRLGKTIPEIAGEKAGIIKENVPVITETAREDALGVFEKKASEMNAPLYRASEIKYNVTERSLEGSTFDADIEGRKYSIHISMVGEHQVQNAVTALYAIAVLRNTGRLVLSDEAVKKGFSRAKQIGRFEVMRENPYVIIDGAHNPDGTRALRDTVLTYFKNKKILITMGILADKNRELIDNMVDISTDFIITEPDNPRKLDCHELAAIIEEKGGSCTVTDSPEEAVRIAESRADDYDLLLFAGSLYLIGEIRGLLK